MSRTFSTLVVAGVLLAAVRAEAQDSVASEGRFTNLATYGISFPVGDTHRYVPNTSWMSIGWEHQWGFTNHLAGSVGVALYDFYDRSDGTINFASGAATGEQQRDLLVTTLMGTGRWFAGRPGSKTPFVGLSAGGSYSQQSYQLGVTSGLTRSAFHLALAPEAGFVFPVFELVDAVVSARYTMQTPSGRYLGGGTRNFPFMTLNIGFAER
jgi:hypothetical protein